MEKRGLRIDVSRGSHLVRDLGGGHVFAIQFAIFIVEKVHSGSSLDASDETGQRMRLSPGQNGLKMLESRLRHTGGRGFVGIQLDSHPAGVSDFGQGFED